ncbi:outer membrane protein [Aestuariivirga sp.]|uniref:outer membrane protein n=1 Tax=Aestuariivirga sp. TaxID=2650926 RepID=UPI003BA8FC6D
MRILPPPITLAAALLAALAGPAAAEGPKPYLRATLGLAWTGDTSFKDADCKAQDPFALFGCGTGENGKSIGARGDFGTTTMLGAGAGLELTSWFRVEAALDLRPNLAFDGNANFVKAGRDQPVSSTVNQADLMAFAYVEPLAAMGVETRLRPYLGLGAGVSRNETSKMTYEFPALAQPRYSVMPGGTHYDFAWAAEAGLGYAVSDRITLELAYRYSDLGQVETDDGTLFVQRATSTLLIPIAATEASLTSQSVTVSARFGF